MAVTSRKFLGDRWSFLRVDMMAGGSSRHDTGTRMHLVMALWKTPWMPAVCDTPLTSPASSTTGMPRVISEERVSAILLMLAAEVAIMGMRIPNRFKIGGPFCTSRPKPNAKQQAELTASEYAVMISVFDIVAPDLLA